MIRNKEISPILWGPPSSKVWHWLHALLKIFFPLSADIFTRPFALTVGRWLIQIWAMILFTLSWISGNFSSCISRPSWYFLIKIFPIRILTVTVTGSMNIHWTPFNEHSFKHGKCSRRICQLSNISFAFKEMFFNCLVFCNWAVICDCNCNFTAPSPLHQVKAFQLLEWVAEGCIWYKN